MSLFGIWGGSEKSRLVLNAGEWLVPEIGKLGLDFPPTGKVVYDGGRFRIDVIGHFLSQFGLARIKMTVTRVPRLSNFCGMVPQSLVGHKGES